MKRGDYVVVVPGLAKNDPWLENFAGDAIWLEYTGPGKRCTARSLFEMDRARGIKGEARTHAPLFVRSDGSALSSQIGMAIISILQNDVRHSGRS